MKLLLDTSVFLWHLAGDRQQPERFKAAISDPPNQAFISVISLWEISIKYKLGKLPLPHPPQNYLPPVIERDGFSILPLFESSVLRLPTLPEIHGDPFDRMLICQALSHDLIFLTVDSQVRTYPDVKLG